MIRAGSDETGSCVLIAVKAVPGAKRDEIAGILGEGEGARLKVRISAAPEGGKANTAICRLIAAALGVKPRDVEIVTGHASPAKTIRIRGIDLAQATARLITPL